MPSTIDPGHEYASTKHISFQFFKQATSPSHFTYEYFVSLPPNYTTQPTQSWPLLLFLHGSGESQGALHESFATLRHGVPKIILCYDRWKDGMNPPHIEVPLAPRLGSKDTEGDRSPHPVTPEVCSLVAEQFITVIPSLRLDDGWGWDPLVLSALLDEVTEQYRVDVDRVHVTGFSMGGHGAWALGAHSPGRFASLVPICGWGSPEWANKTRHLPQWIHHGEEDKSVPLQWGQDMQNSLVKVDAPDVKFTTYPGVGHDSWTDAYGDIDVFKWILSKKRTAVKGEEKEGPDENNV